MLEKIFLGAVLKTSLILLTLVKDSSLTHFDKRIMSNNKMENKWAESYKKANDFISKLNLTERINLLFGTENMMKVNYFKMGVKDFDHHCEGEIDAFKNDKVNFKSICFQDGCSGLLLTNGTSISWQSNLNLASTFNKELIYEVGKEIGKEAREKGVNVILSPNVNILRTPQGGRIWESFGEDPFHVGVCATELIKGIQDAGVIATVKHFVGNEIETYRDASSSNIPMNALMDIYVEPFYRAIADANVGSIMAAYNALNNTYCSENKFLLTDILKKKFDFKGFIVSDFFGVYSNHSDTFNSGLDLNLPGGKMPGRFNGSQNSYWSDLEQWANENITSEEKITDSATRFIATLYQMNQMEDFPDIHIYQNTITDERKKLQRKAATESQILLKNENNILPLKDIKTIAVIGNAALERDCPRDDYFFSCINETNLVSNGYIPIGYGTSSTTYNYLISPLQGIKEIAEEKNIEVISSGRLIYTEEEKDNLIIHVGAQEDIENAVQIAKKADVAIIFVKANSGEGVLDLEKSRGDREDLNVWHKGNELIEKVAEVNENIIVVINAPSVVNLPWLDKVKGILFSGFAGAEAGHAIADILFGKENPSGHLPYVWGKEDDYFTKIKLKNTEILENGKTYEEEYRYKGIDSAGLKDDRPGYDKEQYNYTEGLYVGQRWFNKQNIKPIFPFGFGLSYTTFDYFDLKINMKKEELICEFKIKNIGSVSGKAVPMLFLSFPDTIGDYPKYIFKGYEKVELKAGEEKQVTIIVDDHALSYFNVSKNDYVRINGGKIKVYIAENGNPNEEAKLVGEVGDKSYLLVIFIICAVLIIFFIIFILNYLIRLSKNKKKKEINYIIQPTAKNLVGL